MFLSFMCMPNCQCTELSMFASVYKVQIIVRDRACLECAELKRYASETTNINTILLMTWTCTIPIAALLLENCLSDVSCLVDN